MLLDEPTEGVDILAKAALRAIVRDMARDGNAVLISTSDRDEALELGHRIVVFRGGVPVTSFSRQEATPGRLSAAAQSRAAAA